MSIPCQFEHKPEIKPYAHPHKTLQNRVSSVSGEAQAPEKGENR